jgi:hypothetical protein
MNDPVVLLSIQQDVSTSGSPIDRNREDRVAAGKVRPHARLPRRDGDDRRPLGQQEPESVFA